MARGVSRVNDRKAWKGYESLLLWVSLAFLEFAENRRQDRGAGMACAVRNKV